MVEIERKVLNDEFTLHLLLNAHALTDEPCQSRTNTLTKNNKNFWHFWNECFGAGKGMVTWSFFFVAVESGIETGEI